MSDVETLGSFCLTYHVDFVNLILSSKSRAMLSRIDITDQEFAFLISQKILLSQVYDARDRGPTSFHSEAKSEGKLFGLAKPCHNGGHRLFTRKGHCIQCDTSKIAYIRRYSDSGYIYIAATATGRLLKVGATSDVGGRAATLNSDGGYAGFDDWTVIAHAKTPNMGRVEFEIHKDLESLLLKMEYIRGGRKQSAREVMRGDLKRIWAAYQAAIIKVPETDRWKHSKLVSFDFSTLS